jgi:hypothetical protein
LRRQYARLIAVTLILAGSGCTARHRAGAAEAAVSDAVASQPALRACEVRSFAAGGTDVTLVSNIDGSLGAVRMPDADPDLQAQVMTAVRQRFGAIKRDPRVQTKPGKWGLTVLTDSCGRPLDLSGSSKPSTSP